MTATPIQDDEIWKDVAMEGYGDFYEVSSYGRVRSKDRMLYSPGAIYGYPRLLKGRIRKLQSLDGYLWLSLKGIGRKMPFYVAYLVAVTFIGPRPPGHQVAHNDGVRGNNHAENLRYATRLDNEHDKVKHNTLVQGEKCALSILTEREVREIRRRGVEEDIPTLCTAYGVSAGTIRLIVKNLSWKHLPLLPGECGTPEADAIRDFWINKRRVDWIKEVAALRAAA